MSKAKNWVFTINNYVEGDVERLNDLAGQVKYLVFGKERGEEGTPHLQGFVQFEKRLRLQQVKGLIGERAHLEQMRGTSLQASHYCKKDGDFTEIGELQSQGRQIGLGNYFVLFVMDQ